MYYTFSPQQLSAFLGLIAVPNGRYHTASLIDLSTEETSLSMWMQQALEKHHQSTHSWKGFLGSQQKPRLGHEKKAGEPKCSLGLLTQAPVPVFSVCVCSNMDPAGLRWSSCCAHAVDSSTLGWSLLEQLSHLTN